MESTERGEGCGAAGRAQQLLADRTPGRGRGKAARGRPRLGLTDVAPGWAPSCPGLPQQLDRLPPTRPAAAAAAILSATSHPTG